MLEKRKIYSRFKYFNLEDWESKIYFVNIIKKLEIKYKYINLKVEN